MRIIYIKQIQLSLTLFISSIESGEWEDESTKLASLPPISQERALLFIHRPLFSFVSCRAYNHSLPHSLIISKHNLSSGSGCETNAPALSHATEQLTSTTLDSSPHISHPPSTWGFLNSTYTHFTQFSSAHPRVVVAD